MKSLLPIAILCVLATGAYAQRGGGGGMRSGGGAMRGGGGGFRGGGAGVQRGGFSGGGFSNGGFRGGVGFGGGGFGRFNNGRFGHIRSNSFFGFGFGFGGFGYPYSYSYWPAYPYYGYSYLGGYPYTSLGGYPYDYGYSYAQPGVTVVYGPQQPQYVAQAPVERANPVTREYDQYGQEIQPKPSNASPIYLFAFQDQSIRAASAYWIDGKTLHYVTLQREEKQAPLESLDRALTLQLNRERRVTINLP
jgi:hypothetical protein